MKRIILMVLTTMAFASIAIADEMRLHVFQQGGPASAKDVNENFQALKSKIEAQGQAIAELQKQMQELSGKNSRGVQIQPPETPKGGISEEADGFLFTATGCKRSGSKVKCSLKIMSKGKDSGIRIYASSSDVNYSSKVYDDLGNEYMASHAVLGNHSWANGFYQRTTIADIPTKLTFTFDGIGKEATYIAALEIHYGNGYRIIRLKNIPIN